jgi:hypothetical protein
MEVIGEWGRRFFGRFSIVSGRVFVGLDDFNGFKIDVLELVVGRRRETAKRICR